MSDLDCVPVPDTDVDRLLIDFKFRRMLPYVKGRVLDVGCGIGLITEKLVKYAFDVVGVDGSEDRIDKAHDRLGDSATLCCSRFEYYEPREKFDTVILSSVLEHLSEDEGDKLLRKCWGWLNGGGVVIAAVPNREAFHKRAGLEMGFDDKLTGEDVEVGHVRTYDWASLRKQLFDAGYNISQIGGVLIKPAPSRMLSSWPSSWLEGIFRISDEPKTFDLCSVVYCVGVKR